MVSGIVLSPVVNIFVIISAAVANGQMKVSQTPESAYAVEGESFTFYCAFPLFRDQSNVTISWWKLGDTELLQSGSDGRKRFLPLKKGEASLQLLNVKADDSGVYYCGVKHPDGPIVNGTGSRLVIYVPPIPLKIISKSPENSVPGTLIVLCKTAAFYPDSINLTWYKDGLHVTKGITALKHLNSNGLYEFTSYMEVTRAAHNITCQVTHRTLPIPVRSTFFVSNRKVHRFNIPLIPQFILGFFMILALTLIIADYAKHLKVKGSNNTYVEK
ncbi:immunoglobulin lambda-1 light chain-like isoform X1 [Chiloscyllium plagiosum]|uniref:immunoglobulin lambda-1 light chain-like isoform X1 n=1 Tax=Chiloscyllium plagiosum TaxID=36176 RepID=UPI001CB7E981|nr:immunoglobulin lambda-1 light chain-like isoform X1 [Chiloscyllium plagiosum]